MNVDKYLEKIKFIGPLTHDYDSLRKLCIAHVTSVPYSNACLFGGSKISLNMLKIFTKIVGNGDGGTCVELNALFSWLLSESGFNVRIGQGKFFIGNNFTVPYHHLAPIVTFDDGREFLVDVGWKMHEPVQINTTEPQVQRNGIYRVQKCNDDRWYNLEKLRKTIVNDKDEIIVQGPIKDQWSNIELIHDFIEQSKDCEMWRPICQFTTNHSELKEFQHMIDLWNTDPTSDLQMYLFHHIFAETGMLQLDTNEFTKIEHKSPILSTITKSIRVTDDNQAQDIIQNYFANNLNFKLQYFKICESRKSS